MAGLGRARRMALRWGLILCGLFVLSSLPSGAQKLALTRAEFVRRLATLHEGDRASKVKLLLGAPDEIQHSKAEAGVPATQTWRYGVASKSGLATLGEVYFENDKVETLVGERGTPPSRTVISENELRAAMDA